MSSGKTTSPGWPDPTDWVNRLETATRERAENYLAAAKQRNREPGSYTDDGILIETDCTLQATAVLSAVASALYEFPIFKNHPATTALNDLVFALHDLATGGSPSLLQRGERQEDVGPLGHLTLVGYAALSVRLLREGYNFSDSAARDEVAKRFAKSGTRGRKKGALSASTLQDWQDKYERLPIGHPVRDAMERHWSNWTGDPGWREGRTLQKAFDWIDKLASEPGLINKAAGRQS